MLHSTPIAAQAANNGLETARRAAQARWPEFDVSATEFARFVAERQDAATSDGPYENASDLYLVCACLKNVTGAIRVLEQQYVEPVLPTSNSTVNRDDLRQAVLERLLLCSDNGRCRLAEYSGRASLRAWVRVVAKRVHLNMARGLAIKPARGVHEVLETHLIATGSDPELDYLRVRYASEFKRAFRAAVAKLDSRELLMLRMHVAEKASGAEMAALFGVNRTTVVRWMSDTRHELLTQTRQHLQQELKLSRAECDSVVRLVMRQLDMTLSVLNEGAEA